MQRCQRPAVLFLLLPLFIFCSCSSRWNTQEATLDGAIVIELSDHWQTQQGNESRIDASFDEGEVILAIYPVEGTLDEAVDNLMDAGAYFLTGKSSHGDFSGEYFCLVKGCSLSSAQPNGEETTSQDNAEQVQAEQVQAEQVQCCAVYLFLFQYEDRVYCGEIYAPGGVVNQEEAQAEFDKLLEPGYIVLDTMKKQ